MTAIELPEWFARPLGVLLVDLSLAGDNALAIALICARLPPRSRRTVLLLGTLAAVAVRIVLVGIAGALLAVTGLKLLIGILMAIVALNLARRDPQAPWAAAPLDGRGGVLAAAALVTLVDVMMGLDNVFALAAVAGGSTLYLAIGLGFAVAILMFGSLLLAGIAERSHLLARLGAAVLGWVAGQMAVTDPLFDATVSIQAPALPLLVPLLSAAYVYLVGRTNAPPRRVAIAAPPPRALPSPPPVAPAATMVVVDSDETASEPSERGVLILFVALFIAVGLALGALAVFAGGLVR